MSRHLLLITALLSLPVGTAVAQSKPDSAKVIVVRQPADSITNHLFWGTLGAGGVGPGIGALLRCAYAWGHQSVSAKIEGGATINIFGTSVNTVVEYSLYYGRQTTSNWTMGRIAGGPAYFERTDGSRFIRRVGIGLEAEAMLKLYYIGFSLMTNLMIAPDIYFWGLTANISIGKLY